MLQILFHLHGDLVTNRFLGFIRRTGNVGRKHNIVQLLQQRVLQWLVNKDIKRCCRNLSVFER